ncbi:MAG: recombinase family protein [Synechococcales cyanobacterium M58_A2018_015]|nr:recombinase family protein [Synechococcales cyanobacterium M58_A2018_015]
MSYSTWIVGASCTGKTTRLIEYFCDWAAARRQEKAFPNPNCLIIAALGDNRLDLVDRIESVTHGQYRFDTVSPLGFFAKEVELFWSLLMQHLGLKAPFPLRLHPETEHELATQLWRGELPTHPDQEPLPEALRVKRTLDALSGAAMAGIAHEDIPQILKDGFGELEGSTEQWDAMGSAINRWWQWCLDHGLLTYSILTELYWRYLLPNPVYQQHLRQRYRAIFADDVDEYPAVMRRVFELFLNRGMTCVFTFNPHGGARLGLGADPDFMAELAQRCRTEMLMPPETSLGATWADILVQCIREPLRLPQLPDSIQSIQTTSRAQLLRQTAELIAEAVQSGQIRPQEIAVIAPGMDAIACYTLQEILDRKGIATLLLDPQDPPIRSPLVRALLTLLALVYPGLGRLLDREAIAEMLVVLSQFQVSWEETAGSVELPEFGPSKAPSLSPRLANPVATTRLRIDPVRAGLLSDHCFAPDPDHPKLLPTTTFPRWDRLGYQATQAYDAIRQWVATQQRQLPHPVVLLERAIQTFFDGGGALTYNQLATLRELMEAAQHYWDVEARLRSGSSDGADPEPVQRFIQLLRRGTITGDPTPLQPMGRAAQAVTLANIYQYRVHRCSHRWQFWLDAGSPYWLTGGRGQFAAPLMQHHRPNQPWTAMDALAADQQKLEREVYDLLHRTQERLYLCHCDLALNGQEQAGPLLSLVNAALPVPLHPPSELVLS